MIDAAFNLFMLQAARASKRIEVYIEVFNGTTPLRIRSITGHNDWVTNSTTRITRNANYTRDHAKNGAWFCQNFADARQKRDARTRTMQGFFDIIDPTGFKPWHA